MNDLSRLRDSGWPTELEVVPRLHGLPSGLVPATGKEISWLGDSVVPQCAEIVGWVIRELAAHERRAVA